MSDWTKTRSKIANHRKRLPPDHPIVVGLQRDLRAQRLEDHIERVLGEAPPLTDEQLDRIAGLLRGANA